MCISVEGTAVKILASEFLMIMEIMAKHYRGQFLGHPVVRTIYPT